MKDIALAAKFEFLQDYCKPRQTSKICRGLSICFSALQLYLNGPSGDAGYRRTVEDAGYRRTVEDAGPYKEKSNFLMRSSHSLPFFNVRARVKFR